MNDLSSVLGKLEMVDCHSRDSGWFELVSGAVMS